MKILVTGSQGFVGKRLVKNLKRKGHSVKEFDLGLGNDILNKQQCMQACKGIDMVYHLAAVLDEESKLLFEVNVNGTQNILEAAAKQRCKQFIYLSTVGVNAGIKGVIDEKSPFKPVTKYEQSKTEAEKLVLDSQEMLPITVIRSALVLGPNQYWEKITEFIKKGFPLIGSGKQTWQTIYIDDLVSALLFVLGNSSCVNETFIVAEKETHSLKELYTEMQKQLGLPEKIKTIPVWQAKLLALLYSLKGKKSLVNKAYIERLVRERNYDTGKINSLGWKPKTGMEEAVQKTVQELGENN